MHRISSVGVVARNLLVTIAQARRLAATFSHHQTVADLHAFAKALEDEAFHATDPSKPRRRTRRRELLS